MIVTQIEKDLHKFATKKRKKINAYFFKTGPGEYGEHDKFLGIKNPDVRKVAKKYKHCNLTQLQKIIISPYNEERLLALIILIEKFKNKDLLNNDRKDIYNFYVKNLKFVNNWNLVDLSAPHIAGEYIAQNEVEIKKLDIWGKSDVQWYRRICILTTWTFTKQNNFEYTLKYAKQLLNDEQDLMHKAVGWMLREVWKRDSNICEQFLKDNYNELSRTTLRYAIERMEYEKKKQFLAGNFNL